MFADTSQRWPLTLWHFVCCPSVVSAVAGARCHEAGRLKFTKQKERKKKETNFLREEIQKYADQVVFWHIFFTHWTSLLKRPLIKGLLGIDMSKYCHHHRRLQVSGQISVSMPTKYICPPPLSAESNSSFLGPRTRHTCFNLPTKLLKTIV